jgi:hypothetical protein
MKVFDRKRHTVSNQSAVEQSYQRQLWHQSPLQDEYFMTASKITSSWFDYHPKELSGIFD